MSNCSTQINSPSQNFFGEFHSLNPHQAMVIFCQQSNYPNLQNPGKKEWYILTHRPNKLDYRGNRRPNIKIQYKHTLDIKQHMACMAMTLLVIH